MKNPYISIVVAARNDNYGGDFETRLQNCIAWFDYFANIFHLNAEFIIVNYNPVAERKQLSEIIEFNKDSCVNYRIITVPALFHRQLMSEPIRKSLPFYEYIAKNIGIRRATGEYILSANPDILPDPSIIKHIARYRLCKTSYYRTDRADYVWEKGVKCSPSQLSQIRNSVFLVCTKAVNLEVQRRKIFLFSTLKYKWQSYYFRKYYAYYRRFPESAKLKEIYIPEEYMSHLLHVHASGDFLLMHRNKWFEICGHPENTYLPVHTDSITVAMAASLGLKEDIFFYPCYHQEHERRYENYQDDPDILRMYNKFELDARAMRSSKKPIIYNNSNWGFVNEKFDVISI